MNVPQPILESQPWKLTARWLFPVVGPPLERGILTIAGKRIVGIDSPGQGKADVDLGEAAIFPGLVNAHTHLDLTGARGLCPPTRDFTHWLRRVIAYRNARTPAQVRADIASGADQSLASGVTLLGDISQGGLSLPVLEPRPIRAVVFYEVLGLRPDRAQQAMNQFVVWRDQHVQSPCRRGISPHAPYSVHRQVFKELTKLGGSFPIAIHLAETREELALLEGQPGPFREFLQEMGVWDPEGLSGSIQEMIELQSEERISWIHGNFLTGGEPISPNHTLVYCPRTHAAFHHPPHPFREYLKRGVRVALGTDGLASNPDLDLLAEARFVRRLHPDLAGSDLLRMATLAGAEALGWGDQTGSLEPGKYADLVVIPLTDSQDPDPHSLIFDSNRPVLGVMIAGDWIHTPKETRAW